MACNFHPYAHDALKKIFPSAHEFHAGDEPNRYRKFIFKVGYPLSMYTWYRYTSVELYLLSAH